MGPLHMFLVTIGSSGDVHPFVAYGIELRRRGHRVTVMTNAQFESLVRRAGLDFIEQGSAQQYDQSIRHADLWHPTRSYRYVIDLGVIQPMRPVYDAIASCASDRSLVVVHSTLAVGARIAQERLGVTTVTVNLSPSVFRSVFHTPVINGLWLPPWLPRWIKRAVFDVGDLLVADRWLAKPINRFRAELGLGPVRHILDGWLHSPTLTLGAWPPWFGPVAPDWPPGVRLTGFPLFDGLEATPVPRDVRLFLKANPKPMVFTCGSAMTQGKDFFAASARVCRVLDRPGLLLTPYSEQIPSQLPGNVRHVPYVRLDGLLPHAAVLVHHGGVGTMAAGIAAGVPQLVVPMAFDQPDNAQRLTRLGLGASMGRSAYRGRQAAKVLARLIGSASVRSACQAAAAKIDRRTGVDAACDAIEAAAGGV